MSSKTGFSSVNFPEDIEKTKASAIFALDGNKALPRDLPLSQIVELSGNLTRALKGELICTDRLGSGSNFDVIFAKSGNNVRRQSFRKQEWSKIGERLACGDDVFMQRVACNASVALRTSFVRSSPVFSVVIFATEVDVGGCEVVLSLVVALMIVPLDGGFKLSCQAAVFQQDRWCCLIMKSGVDRLECYSRG